MLFSVKKSEEPKRKIDEIVYYIDEKTRTVQIAKIFYIEFILVKNNRRLWLINPKYVLIKDNGPVDGVFDDENLYAKKREALKMARWCPIKGVSRREWFKAIGDPSKKNGLANCELQACCGWISSVREDLFQCKDEGGLIWRDVLKIKDYFSHCDYPLGENRNRPKILDKILGQLGLRIISR